MLEERKERGVYRRQKTEVSTAEGQDFSELVKGWRFESLVTNTDLGSKNFSRTQWYFSIPG